GLPVADLAGDPAPRTRRLARTALRIGLLGGWAIGFGTFMMGAWPLGTAAIIATFIPGMLAFAAIVHGLSWLIFQYRFSLGESLTREDHFQGLALMPQDRLTGTRLVVRRAAAPRPVPAPTASAG